jgi:peptidoglycan/LPS O-acetylase OafA/YrhL
MQENKQSLERPEFWAVLGGVRFALAGIVLCGHLVAVAELPWALRQVVKLSAPTAVFCFLVLSGFSIAHSLSRNREHFYRRRFLRIYPLYVVAILWGALVSRSPGFPLPAHARGLLANLLFLQTFVAAPMAGNPVVWSLALEVACYAMAPFFQRMRSSTLLIITGISAVVFVAHPVVVGLHYFTDQRHGLALLALGWAWLAGFMYYRHHDHPWAGILLMGGMVALTSMNQWFTESLQHITVVASIGLLVAGRSIAVKPTARRLLDYLGNLSYPLYLMHMPVLAVFKYALHSRNYGLAAVLSLALSMAAMQIEPRLRAGLTALMDATGLVISGLRRGGRQVARRIAASSSATSTNPPLPLTTMAEL